MAKLLTAKEAAEKLNINIFTLYKLSREKVIPSVRIGRRLVRFSEEHLRQWVYKNTVKERNPDEDQTT